VSLKLRGTFFRTDYLRPGTSLHTLTKEDTILEVSGTSTKQSRTERTQNIK